MKKFKNLIEKMDLNHTVSFLSILLVSYSLHSKGLDLSLVVVAFSVLFYFFVYQNINVFTALSILGLFLISLSVFIKKETFSNELGIALYYLLLLVLIFSLGEEFWKKRIKIAKKASQIYKNVIRWLHSCIFSKNK